jgi:RimJ/RimL family protein N-acetyltransferase
MTAYKSRNCTDKFGHPIVVEECGRERHDELIEMYNAFSPKAIAQGLPPRDDAQRLAWIEQLLDCGRNFLVSQDGTVVGHAALFPDFDRLDAEYVIFIDQRYRNRGMGSELTSLAVETARDLGIQNIWLTVEATNLRAIRVYKKVGFKFCDEYGSERTMILGFL